MSDGNEWISVAEASALRPGTVTKVQAVGATLALICSSDGLFAMSNACPHEGGPLGEGNVEGTTITCPLHGLKFDCKSGACTTESRYKVSTYETKMEKGKVWVRVATGADAAVAATSTEDPSKAKSPVELWKMAKHGLDVWPDVLRYAQEKTPMAKIEIPDLERMKWYGFFYRKNNDLDHYMCRIRIPGSELTQDQARAIAFTAYEAGYSLVDVTTRCNMQIQGLTIDKLPVVRAALEKVGLTSGQTGHDNVRNITSHPYSGIDSEELIDTRELSRQIQDMIVGNREFSDLPRKFNIAMTGRTDPATHAWTQDISYVGAWGPSGRPGFQLLLGGSQGQASKLATHVPVFVRPEQVLDVTAATLRTFRELGYRHNRHQVRFRYLIERIGLEQVLAEIEKRLDYALERFAKAPPKPSREENFMGWFRQKQHDLWAVGICIPVGRLTWDQLEGLALVANQYGWGTLRTTYDQNIVIPGIPSSAKSSAGYAIAKYGLTFEPDPVTRNVVSCTGKQFCNLAVTETKGYAYQLIEALRRRNVQLHGIGIGMSGCPSSCGMSHTADIGLKGGKIRRGLRVLDAFDVYLGGGVADDVRMGTLYKKTVPVDQLPDCIERIVAEFYRERGKEETFSQYWQNKLKGHKAEAQSGEIARWRCSHCGLIHVAQDPPAFCPVCAALRGKFEPAPEDALASLPPAPAPVHEQTPPVLASGTRSTESIQDTRECRGNPTGKRLLIIGGSIAGHTAAQTARSLDASARITLITDERHSFYNRLNLTRFLSQEVKHEELFDYKPRWYEENQIEILTNTRAIGIDHLKKQVLLGEGRTLSYDTCVLAHGSSANVPSFYRPDVPGVFLLRTLDDVEGMLAKAQKGMNLAVIGGGVLGLEAAYGMVKQGANVRVFEYFPYLMPRQLDKAGAALFTTMIREKGIEPHVGVGVQAIVGSDRVEALTLADGRRFAADLVIVSAGIKPNIDWVKRSGIHCDRGITVDDRMQTSAEDVYAAGDVAQWHGQVIGLWTNAVEQAKVAAANAVGKMAFFQGFLPVTILKCLGIPLVSIGDIKEDGDGITSKVMSDPVARTYRRVVMRNGIPIGGILLGTSDGMGELRKLIENGLELEKLQKKVMPDEALVPV